MKCLACEKEFKGEFEWLRINDYKAVLRDNTDIFCNDCCKYILEARQSILLEEAERLEDKIRTMRG